MTRSPLLAMVAFTFLSGIVMGLAVPPVGFWPVAWFALAPLWAIVARMARSPSPHPWRFLALVAFLWGLSYHATVLWWIVGIHPMTWLGIPWLQSLAIALFCWGFIAVWGAGFVTLWAIAFARWLILWQRFALPKGLHILGEILVGTALWCLWEAGASRTALWWGGIALSQSPGNPIVLHLGQLSGPATIAAVLVAINGTIAQLFASASDRQRWRAIAAALLGAIAAFAVGGTLRAIAIPDRPESALQMGIIQGNIPNEIKFGTEGWRRALTGYVAGYERLANDNADVVLLPETALPWTWESIQRNRGAFYEAVQNRGVPALVGAFGRSRTEGGNLSGLTNSLFAIGDRGDEVARYDKIQLVPLGEFIPFQRWLGRFIDRLSPLDAYLVAGSRERRFVTPVGMGIAGICYDSAFPEVFRTQAARGGQFIVTASNNAHYHPAMYAQHVALDLLRAIETDRWLARAANTGASGLLTPRGDRLNLAPAKTYATRLGTIYSRQTQTPYVRWGDWLTPLLVAIGMVLTAGAIAKHSQSRLALPSKSTSKVP